MAEIFIKNLSFHYADDQRTILENITAQFSQGEFVCILGQSGCGKSTLLRLFAGLETASAGEILIGEEKIQGTSLQRAVVFQDYGLFPWLSIGKNILIALQQCFPKEDKKKLEKRVGELLQIVGLKPELYHKLPKSLSGGMKQRTAIAQAFGMDAPILLMDEPFGALDAITRRKLQRLLISLCKERKERKTVLFVTHDIDEALLLADRIFVLGQAPSHIIHSVEIPKDLRNRSDLLFENEFFITQRNTLLSYLNEDIEKGEEESLLG